MVNSWKSTKARIRFKKLREKIQKERAEVDKKLCSLKSEKFACIPDAEIATRKALKNFLYHELTEINVQEVKSNSETNFPYIV